MYSIKLTLSLFLLCIWALPVLPAASAEVFTIRCEPPEGQRINAKSSEYTVTEDGFKNVHPVFIYDPARRAELLVLFGSVKAIGPTRFDNATKATLVMASKAQMTAVEVLPKAVWTYSLFPLQGIGLFHRTSHLLGTPHSSVFYSRCKFSANK